MVEWPGVEMNSLGNDIYGYTVPEGVEYVIFTDGNAQTEDLTLQGLNKVYVDGEWTDTGAENNVKPKENKYVYYKNTQNWWTVCAYYWNDANTKMTTWPGVEMKAVGDGVYRIEVPKDAKYIIFSDGSGNQTEDIQLEGTNKIFTGTEWNDYNE